MSADPLELLFLGSEAGVLMSIQTDEAYDDSLENESAIAQARWYAVQVASGCEKRVKTNLEQRIQTLDVRDRILQVEIPQTRTLKMLKDGTRKESEEKVFPGYVLVRMRLTPGADGELEMDDEAWQVSRTPQT